MEKRTFRLSAGGHHGVGVEAAVGAHGELPAGPAVAHPAHRLPQEVGGTASGVGPALTQPRHQHLPGASPSSPGPCQQLAADPVQLAECPHRKLRRNVPRVDGALTTQPSAPAVPPARNASASSMQSPQPGRRPPGHDLSAGVGSARGRPRSQAAGQQLGQAEMLGQVAGRISPALSTRRWSSKATWMWSGRLRGSIHWVLLVWVGFVFGKPLSQMHRSTFLPLQYAATLIFSVD